MRRLRRSVAGVAVLALVAVAATASGQSWTAPRPSDKIENGVNWTTQFITATGIGIRPPSAVSPAQARALAVTAATVLARAALLDVIRGVTIDKETAVVNHIAEEAVLQRVSGFIRGAAVVATKDMPDGSVEVTVALPATGEFADLFLPRPAAPPPVAAVPPAPSPSPAPAGKPLDTVYTGLVIDARGLGIKPAMAPKVVSEAGQEIYGFSVVDRNWVIQQGMAGYSKDLTAAQAHERVANRPLTIKAVAAAGANKTDVVVATADAQLLLGSGQHLAFLEKARVMLVVD